MKVLVIAEAGVNHNGDLRLAKKLVEEAAKAGADIIKFQTFKADKLATRQAPKAEYQQMTTEADESQQDMVRKLELSRSDHIELIEECNRHGIEFFSTAFDMESIELLSELVGNNYFKIPSGELTNLPYLRSVPVNTGTVLLSTGMANLGEVEAGINVLESIGISRNKLIVLHCTTEYPAPFTDVNLKAMENIGNTFGVNVGYSDHTTGIEVPIAAVALGALVIEKHFTLDRTLPGPDHKASLEPSELKLMIESIRNVEKSLGNGIKSPSRSELKNIPIARKSIVAACHISSGDKFSEENLTTKRPGNGISPMLWDDLLGRVATRDFEENELIEI